jgi:DNA-binding PadR family transcriptional regulator
MLKYALLGFLNYSPATGYDLKQFLDISTSYFWHAKQSQIYTTLKKMEEDDLVSSRFEPQEGRPNRRVYTISKKGKEELQTWLNKPLAHLEKHKETLLLKLFFSAEIERDVILAELNQHVKLHQKQLRIYQTITKGVIDQFKGSTGLNKDAECWEMTRRFGELYEQMYLTWFEEIISKFDEKEE